MTKNEEFQAAVGKIEDEEVRNIIISYVGSLDAIIEVQDGRIGNKNVPCVCCGYPNCGHPECKEDS